jgi:hypothetical protein
MEPLLPEQMVRGFVQNFAFLSWKAAQKPSPFDPSNSAIGPGQGKVRTFGQDRVVLFSKTTQNPSPFRLMSDWLSDLIELIQQWVGDRCASEGPLLAISVQGCTKTLTFWSQQFGHRPRPRKGENICAGSRHPLLHNCTKSLTFQAHGRLTIWVNGTYPAATFGSLRQWGHDVDHFGAKLHKHPHQSLTNPAIPHHFRSKIHNSAICFLAY